MSGIHNIMEDLGSIGKLKDADGFPGLEILVVHGLEIKGSISTFIK